MNSFEGRVIEGKRLGRTIGFPTANLETACAPQMAYGVYAAVVETAGGRHRGMMNVGAHPTVPEGRPTIEIHLLDFSGDLYGQMIRVEVVSFLRAERRFESLGALTEQLKRDKIAVYEAVGEEKLTKSGAKR